jgi:hypothetical protein
MSDFDSAMGILLEIDKEKVESAVELLIKIVQNIVNNPHEEKFRKLKASNKAFDSKIGSVRGGNDCMAALGFECQASGEWILTPTEAKWNLLVAALSKMNKFLARLKPPQDQQAMALFTAALQAQCQEVTSSTSSPTSALETVPAPDGGNEVDAADNNTNS